MIIPWIEDKLYAAFSWRHKYAHDYFENVKKNRRIENDKQSEIINFIF